MQSSNATGTGTKFHKISRALLVTVVFLVIALSGFAYYYFHTSAMISYLRNEVMSDKSQISSLQDQISSTSSQIFNLQSQISSLESQNSHMQSIIDLSQSSTKVNLVTINQASEQSTLVVKFTAEYAGYIVVSGTSTTRTGYIKVTDSYSGYPYNNYSYPFGTGWTFVIPVLPGTVSVYFGNNDVVGATATMTVTYYY